MEPKLPILAYTQFADLDLLFAEEEHDAPLVPAAATADDGDEPETVDAFNAQILAGLVSP
jgi:hypothetical protein